MSSDIRTKRVTTTGDVGVGPARLRGVHVVSSVGGGRVTITDGSGGDVMFDADFSASETNTINFPEFGIRCQTGIQVSTLTNVTSMTVFYA